MMFQNQSTVKPSSQTTWSSLFSKGVLFAEAAIATTVLSIFVSTGPSLMAEKPDVTPSANVAAKASPQLMSIRLPVDSMPKN